MRYVHNILCQFGICLASRLLTVKSYFTQLSSGFCWTQMAQPLELKKPLIYVLGKSEDMAEKKMDIRREVGTNSYFMVLATLTDQWIYPVSFCRSLGISTFPFSAFQQSRAPVLQHINRKGGCKGKRGERRRWSKRDRRATEEWQ